MNPGHSRYLGISEDAQKRNMRAIHVNAQVTAVTTIFEFIGNCIFAILFTLMKGQGMPEFTSLVLLMLLHFVCLSYAFLMNTPYNKNRIIEHGWINVLKNIIDCNQHSVQPSNIHGTQKPWQEASRVTCNKTKTAVTAEKHENKDIYIISNKQTFTNENVLDEEKVGEIIRTPKMNLIQTLSRDTLNLKHDKTFNSWEEIDDKNEKETYLSAEIHPYPSSSTQGESLKSTYSNEVVKRPQFGISIIEFRTKILSELLLYITDEDKYITSFVKLVQKEEAYKNNQDINSLDDNDHEVELPNLPHFIGTVQRKLEMRTSILQTLNNCKNNMEMYAEFLEQFISMEEGFLENGC